MRYVLFLLMMAAALAQYNPPPGLTKDTNGNVAVGTFTTLPKNLGGVRIATEFSGASIVEKIQAAVNDLGGTGTVRVPTGNGAYTASGCSTWQADYQGAPEQTGQRTGVKIPSGVTIVGDGPTGTVINVARSGSDPSCSLFANANRTSGNSDIRISGITINWTDSTSGSFNGVFAVELEQCDRCEVDHVVVSGNPNAGINLLDSTRFNVHDSTFLVNTTGTGYGDHAVSANRFGGSLASPTMPTTANAGKITGNQFIEIGSVSGAYSLLVVSQSNVITEGNTFDNLNWASGSGRGGSLIETGNDNLGMRPRFLKYSNNKLICGNSAGPGFYPTSASDISISDNDSVGCSITLTAADTSTESNSNNVVTRNKVAGGGSINVQEASTGGQHFTEVSYNVIEDAGGGVGYGIYAQANNQNSALNVVGNVVKNPDAACIDAAGARAFKDNTCINPGQLTWNGGANFGFGVKNPGGSLSAKVIDVSNNLIIDDQTAYSTGTICSVSSPSSTTCLSSGVSIYVYSAGASWSAAWTNRNIYVGAGATRYAINGILNANYMQLEAPVLIASGSSYVLHTSLNWYWTLGASIGTFANNRAFGSSTTGDNYIHDSAGNTVDRIFGNYFAHYSASTGNYDYRQSQVGPLAFDSYTVASPPVNPTAGMIVFFSNGKNNVDDAAAVGSVLAASGHGVHAAYANGSWRTLY